MCDPLTKRGVLNDFDLARLGGPNRKPSAKDNTGTLPFLPLDLLHKAALDGTTRRLYRHDAESFAWCLIYICISMGKDDEGRIGTRKPHPLSPWFTDLRNCLASKTTLTEDGLLKNFRIHHKLQPLTRDLYNRWILRWDAGRSARRMEEPYNELPDKQWFKQVYRLHFHATYSIPDSKSEDFRKIHDLVITLYPFVTGESTSDAS